MEANKENLIIIYSQIESCSIFKLFKHMLVTFPGKKAVSVPILHGRELPRIGISTKI